MNCGTFYFLFLLCLLFNFPADAQEGGEIFYSRKADRLFGPVIKSVEIPSKDLLEMLKNTEGNAMFNIEKEKLQMLGDNRNNLMEDKITAPGPEVVFQVAGKSKIIELIESGGSEITRIEKREKHYTITNGMLTLEKMWPCPPFCE